MYQEVAGEEKSCQRLQYLLGSVGTSWDISLTPESLRIWSSLVLILTLQCQGKCSLSFLLAVALLVTVWGPIRPRDLACGSGPQNHKLSHVALCGDLFVLFRLS